MATFPRTGTLKKRKFLWDMSSENIVGEKKYSRVERLGWFSMRKMNIKICEQ